mgnify:FL=1
MKHVHLAGNGKPQKKQRREESVRRPARAIAETELDKFPDGLSGEERKQLA